MNVINATYNHINDILKIYHLAVNHMKEEKNFNQWTASDEQFIDSIRKYIDNNEFYLMIENDEIVAFFAMINGIDETYNIINGKWLNDDSYITIHKIAVKYFQRGIFSKIIEFVENQAVKTNVNNIRVDTHKDNISMNTSLKNKGFTYCGIISLNKDFNDENALRNAYHKIIK